MNTEILRALSLDKPFEYFQKYRTPILVGVGSLTALVGLLGYWQYTRIKQNESAYIALAETFGEYNKAHQSPDLWTEVEMAAKTGYGQNNSSNLAPYFLMLEADALAHQNMKSEALTLMEKGLKSLSTRSPFYYSFSIKLARMKLDTNDEAVRADGLKELTSLADNAGNPQQDEALYYLGLHYHNVGDTQKATDIWKQLTSFQQGEQKDATSPWAALAKQMMK